jgi:hypothetical protein
MDRAWRRPCSLQSYLSKAINSVLVEATAEGQEIGINELKNNVCGRVVAK